MIGLNFSNYKNKSLQKPYLIAEAGVNYESSIDNAKKMIHLANEGGANAIKFQAYKAENLASKYSPAYWDTNKEKSPNQFELFKKHDKFWKTEFEMLKKVCDQSNIDFLCTPFDFQSAFFLNNLVNTFKISSSDINNKPFIEYIASFGKPIILSTGASNVNEIKDAVKWINNFNCELCLLHCVLNYPTKDENANLARITNLKVKFSDIVIGYSDHTLPKNMDTLVTAWLLGANIIEKHFTFDKKIKGNDHYHSMDKADIKLFLKKVDYIIKILGDGKINFSENEQIPRDNARRSIVVTKDMFKGEKINKKDVNFKRPGNGISPKNINEILGKKLIRNINKDISIKWDDIK